MVITQYTSTKSFRNFYRTLVALTAIAIVVLAFGFNTQSQAAMVPCSTNAVGSANITANFDASTSAVVWVQISNSASVELEAKVNSTCAKKTFPTKVNGDLNWQKFDDQFSFNQGSNNLTISSFGGALTLYKVALVTDGQTPTGDGSNVVVITQSTTTTTMTPTTAKPVDSTTTTAPGATTTKVNATTTTQPATTTTTQAGVTTTQPSSTTTKVSTSTTNPSSSTTTLAPTTAVTTSTTVPSSSTVTSSSTTVVINPTTAPTTAPGITVAGTNVTQTTAVANTGNTLPFTGSSSRMMLIVALSAMLAGLIALGVSKQLLYKTSK